jgi:branched-chain amino acid transport system ATP-binding protein
MLGDRDVTGWAPHRRAQAGIGRTFQQPALLRRESCLSNVAAAVWRRDGGGFAMLARPVRRRAVAAEAHRRLAEVGLTGRATRPAGQLSHAQQRQLELAVALAGRPDLLLLDEPAAGLARPDLARLSELIRDLPAELTVLLVDHDLDLVFDLATTVTVLDRGRVILTAPPAEVWADARAAEVYLGAPSTVDDANSYDRPTRGFDRPARGYERPARGSTGSVNGVSTGFARGAPGPGSVGGGWPGSVGGADFDGDSR